MLVPQPSLPHVAFWTEPQSWELEFLGPAAYSATGAGSDTRQGLPPDPPRHAVLHPEQGQLGWVCWFPLSCGSKYHPTKLGTCLSLALSPLKHLTWKALQKLLRIHIIP